MVAHSIREKLQSLDGQYKFNDLLTFMEKSCITFTDRQLNGSMAIATLDGVIVDVFKISHYPDKLIFFIFIHEIAHMKRLIKKGKEWFLGQLSIENYQEFTSELFKEEILADRYACRMFYKLNGIIYPWNQTQQLNLPERQKAYAPMAGSYFGKINNNEETYRELIQSFIK